MNIAFPTTLRQPREARAFGSRCSIGSRQNGVVLPIVLVILVILTALVVTQVRRTTVDQRLAANAQESLALDAAAKAVLGWCEAEVFAANMVAGRAMPRMMTAPVAPAPAVWRILANWNAWSYTPATDMGALELLQNITQGLCLIEEATGELDGPVGSQTDGGAPSTDCRWRKYRTTAQVRMLAPDLPAQPPFIPAGERGYFVQGEMRVYSNLACPG